MTLLETIGQTPLVPLKKLSPRPQVIWAKCEFYNPTGSIKDRIVAHIITQAENQGRIKPGDVLVESTSGNTGAAVAMIAAQKGYRAILTMPDKVSLEKQAALKALGADIRIMPGDVLSTSPQHYINAAKQIHLETPNSFYLDQYNNPQNPEAHYLTTGPEIWQQTGGEVDALVSVAGSGGTISGIGRYLKEKNPKVLIIVPDPVGSVYYPYFKTKQLPEWSQIKTYHIEGVGQDHLVDAMDFSVIDDMLQFTDQNAFLMARRLACEEGILAGGSSGANVWAALQVAAADRELRHIVTILPDHGIKYLSKFYNDNWVREQQLGKL